jgi:hypothetical protein
MHSLDSLHILWPGAVSLLIGAGTYSDMINIRFFLIALLTMLWKLNNWPGTTSNQKYLYLTAILDTGSCMEQTFF